jgi:hypothetical protein
MRKGKIQKRGELQGRGINKREVELDQLLKVRRKKSLK